MRRILFIVTGAVILMVLYYVFFLRKPQPQLSTQIPIPSIVDRSEIKLNIESQLKPDSIKIPATLPVYTVTTGSISFGEADTIAKNLGFTGQAERSSDVNSGIVYDWISDTSELLVIASVRVIDYKNTIISDLLAAFPTEADLATQAKTFLQKNGFLEGTDVEFTSVGYLKADATEYGASDKNAGNIADVQFVEKAGDYPIVNSTPGVGSISVKIDRAKNVVAVYIDKSGKILDKKDYPTKSFKDLVANLPNAKIQMVGTPFHRDTDIVDATQIKKIVVDSASIAYLKEYSSAQTFLQPIFVLRGAAQMQSGESLSALLYLPALSDQSLKQSPTPTP